MKKLIQDDLRVSTFLADFHFWVNDTFKVVEKILKSSFFQSLECQKVAHSQNMMSFG